MCVLIKIKQEKEGGEWVIDKEEIGTDIKKGEGGVGHPSIYKQILWVCNER